MKPPRSLQGRALQLLAQREQSPLELRRKLLAFACTARAANDPLGGPRAGIGRSDENRTATQDSLGARTNSRGGRNSESHAGIDVDMDADVGIEAEVDRVLAWLEAKGFLSAERFVASRLNVRSPRFGNLRIRNELTQHGLGLSAEASRALAESEFARAAAVRARKFSAPPSDLKEAAQQSRFLAARGFSPDVIRGVLRAASRSEPEEA